MSADITIIGNLTADPELRFLTTGVATASIRVAVSHSWVDKTSGERQEETSFFDVVCWGTLAENVNESLGKGDRAIVFGRVRERSWQTESGEPRRKHEIQAKHVGPDLVWQRTTGIERTNVRNDRPQPQSNHLRAVPNEQPF